MADLSQLTDEQLLALAQGQQGGAQAPANPLASIPNDQLVAMALHAQQGGQTPAEQPGLGSRMWDALKGGFGHRTNVEQERDAFAADNPVSGAVMQAMPFGLGRTIPVDWLRSLAPGQAQQLAHAATVSQDQADKANHVGEGFLPAVAYGTGESPETLLFPQLRALKGAGLLAKGANAALSGAAMGAYDATQNDRSVAEGAGLGAAGGLAGSAVGGALGKVFNAVRGKWADAGLQAADQAAASQGVNLRIGDLAPEGAFRKFEDIAKFVPGSGAPGAIKEQAQALGESVSKLQGQLEQPIAAKLAAGMSPEQIVVESARAAQAHHEGVARAMFEAVPGDVAVDPHGFMPALRELSSEYPELLSKVDAPQSIQRKVGAMLNPHSALSADELAAVQLASQSGLPLHAQSQILDQLVPGGSATIAQKLIDAQSLNAGEAHWISSGLGDLERALSAQTAQGGRLGSAGRLVTKARSALLDDIDNVDNGQLRNARRYFADNVMPYRDDTMLRKLVSDDATAGDRLFENIGANDVGKAKLLMQSLTPEGQDALRYGFIARSGNKAVNDNFASGLSTAKIRKGFDVGDALGQNRQLAEIFTPAQQEAMTGIRDIAQYADRSATWAHNPHTGAQNLPLNLAKLAGSAVGGHAIGLSAPAAVLGPLAAARGVTAFSRSKLGKNLYFGEGGTPADPVLAAMMANAAAARAEPSLLDMLGGP